MEKQLLESLIAEGLSSYSIALRVGKSQTTVRHWLEKHGLKTNPLRYQARLKPKSVRQRERNLKCYAYQKRMQQDRKKELVLLSGGKCQVCSYAKNYAALEFHHRNPKEKDFSVDAYNLRVRYEDCKTEVLKCDLLCANCHRELHHPEKTL